MTTRFLVPLALLASISHVAAAQSARGLLLPPPARSWQVVTTPSFRVFHFNPALARRLAATAESQRTMLMARWGAITNPRPWQPRCDIYLYPSNRELSVMTGGDHKLGSATAAQSRLVRGQVYLRRINLAADDRSILGATLPHEITHVILKDLAPNIPLWADEGAAVSSEPADHQRRFLALLYHPSRSGPLYPASKLIAMRSYPNESYKSLYYAQSYALVRFLLFVASPARLVDFLRERARTGDEQALKRVYGLAGFAELEPLYRTFIQSESKDARGRP